MAITEELKPAWLAELRNPNNVQSFGRLFGGNDVGIYDSGKALEQIYAANASCMCALGCLVKAHAQMTKSTPSAYMHASIIYQLYPHEMNTVINMNDYQRLSLPEIADRIENGTVL